MPSFEEYLDIIDSFVFTGDTLHNEENREIFREYLERWDQAVTDFEEGEYDDDADS